MEAETIAWVGTPDLDDFVCGIEYVVQISDCCVPLVSFKSMVVAKTRGQNGDTWVRFDNGVVLSDVDSYNGGISITRDLRAWDL